MSTRGGRARTWLQQLVGRGVAAVLILMLACWSAPARADFYSDTGDIIKELVQDELAQSVVPRLAGYIPPLCEFFPSSLAALQHLRFSGLPQVMRREVADAAGFTLLLAFGPADKPSEGTEGSDLDKNEAKDVKKGQQKDPKKAQEEAAKKAREEELKEDRLKAEKVLVAGVAAPPPAVPGKASAPLPLKVQPVPDALRVPKKCAKAWPNGAKQPDFSALTSLATERLRDCEAQQPTMKDEVACAAALLLRDAVLDDKASISTGARRLATALVLGVVNQYVGLSFDSPDVQKFVIGLHVAIRNGRLLAEPDKVIEELLNGIDLNVLKTKLEEIAKSPVLSVEAKTRIVGIIASLSNSAAALKAFANQLKEPLTALALVDFEHLNPETSLQAGRAMAKFCLDATAPPTGAKSSALPTIRSACAAISLALGGQPVPDVATSLDAAALAKAVRLLHLVESRNYGAAAALVIDSVAADQRDCGDSGDRAELCGAHGEAVTGFIRSLVVYGVDSLFSGGASATTSADFRRAAVDLIRENGGSGVWRTWSRKVCWLPPCWFWPGLTPLVPKFALRTASRPGTEDQFADYPSMDMFSWKLSYPRWQFLHITYNVSAVDLLGPFSELAMRRKTLRDTASGDQESTVFAWAFLVPRFDIEFAVPALSPHLAVGAGAAMRFYYPGPDDPNSAHYCLVVDSGCPFWTFDNLEVSLFVKYVP